MIGLALGLLAAGPLRADLVDPDPQPPATPDAMTQIVNDAVTAGTPEQRFVFDAYTIVSGSGRFEYTDILGTFAPGNSPGIAPTTNLSLGGTLRIELGGNPDGTTAGPGGNSNNHDQVNDAGTITLFNSPTLEILSFEDFLPAPGERFEVLTWQDGLNGNFATTSTDPYFTSNNITFQQIITNPFGAGNLTLVAVAIPEPSAFLFLGALSVLMSFCDRSAKVRRQANFSK